VVEIGVTGAARRFFMSIMHAPSLLMLLLLAKNETSACGKHPRDAQTPPTLQSSITVSLISTMTLPCSSAESALSCS
jgi:hypothetical protein